MENPKILLESNRGHKGKLVSMGMGSKPSAKDPRADQANLRICISAEWFYPLRCDLPEQSRTQIL